MTRAERVLKLAEQGEHFYAGVYRSDSARICQVVDDIDSMSPEILAEPEPVGFDGDPKTNGFRLAKEWNCSELEINIGTEYSLYDVKTGKLIMT